MVHGTVYAAFQRSVERYRDLDFLCVLAETARHYGISARTFSYGEAADEVSALIRHYAGAGLQPGQRVALAQNVSANFKPPL